MINYILLLLGFAMLIKGADVFVTRAANIAACLHVPSLVIGLTIVAFGTSAPETAVSITAAIAGSNAIAVGNVVGSNIFNLLVVTGAAALVMPLSIQPSLIKRDIPATVIFSVLLLTLCFGFAVPGAAGGSLGRIDGLILLAMMIGFTWMLVQSAMKNRKDAKETMETMSTSDHFLLKNFLLLVVALGVIVAGGKLVVYSATLLAQAWGWSERVIGLTIVALGTSLPELCTSTIAAFRGENDLALGNVLGSNILNVGFVLGISALIMPIPVEASGWTDMLIMVGSIVIFAAYAALRHRLGRLAGVVMLSGYAGYVFSLL